MIVLKNPKAQIVGGRLDGLELKVTSIKISLAPQQAFQQPPTRP